MLVQLEAQTHILELILSELKFQTHISKKVDLEICSTNDRLDHVVDNLMGIKVQTS